jgi:ACR3 family arsenite transporter
MKPATSPLGIFERYLSVWVALCIAAGVALGNLAPGLFAAISRLEVRQRQLRRRCPDLGDDLPDDDPDRLRRRPRRRSAAEGLIITLVDQLADQAVHDGGARQPVLPARVRRRGSPSDARQYIAGAMLLGVAPCTAMVFVWSQLTRGDPGYTLVQVAVNDLIMVVAFAPITALLLGVSDITSRGPRCCCRSCSTS